MFLHQALKDKFNTSGHVHDLAFFCAAGGGVGAGAGRDAGGRREAAARAWDGYVGREGAG